MASRALDIDLNDNSGSPDKILSFSNDQITVVVWIREADRSAINAFILGHNDYIACGTTASRPVYWSRDKEGSIYILIGDLESWDVALRLSDDDARRLVGVLTLSPQPGDAPS
jgi:hypothetical protein